MSWQDNLSKMPRTLGVIPARLASSRFPNKPLYPIMGIPMIGHCLYRAQRAKMIDKLILATPDMEIFELGEKLGFECMMTSAKHERATERAAEVLESLETQKKHFENIVLYFFWPNLQKSTLQSSGFFPTLSQINEPFSPIISHPLELLPRQPDEKYFHPH